MSIKVLVVDDSALIREVLTRTLGKDGDIMRGRHRRRSDRCAREDQGRSTPMW